MFKFPCIKGKSTKTKFAFPNCTASLYALIITDTHCHMTPEQFNEFLKDVEQIDVVFSLGDVDTVDFKTLNNNERLKNVPKYGLLGNHDEMSQLENTGFSSLHGKTVIINGFCFAGIEGSIKYKETMYPAPMLTDEESLEIAKELPPCDVLLTHDKAKLDKNAKDFVHAGLPGITWYLQNKRATLHIHGHLHENMKEDINGVTSYGIARYAYIIFEKDGMKILKNFEGYTL